MHKKISHTNSSSIDSENKDLSFKDEAVFHRMIENIEDYAILLIDKNGIILNWNKGAENIKGYHSSEIIGKNFRVFYSSEDRSLKLPEKLLKTAQKLGTANHEGWRVKKDGTAFWGSVNITSLYNHEKKVVGFTKVTKDLTDKRATNEKIRRAILDAQEKERTELSEILHDNVSQILVAGKMFAKMAEEKCKSEHLPLLQKYIGQAIDELGKISHRLNPVSELSRDLSEAITLMIDDLNVLAKTRFTFSVTGNSANISPEIKKMIFRICQELVANILKYSNAAEADISLTCKRKGLVLQISDNGIGFDLSKIKKGLGMENMELRLKNYNGSSVIRSNPGGGCSIKISVPLA